MIQDMRTKFWLMALPVLLLPFMALAQTSATATSMVVLPGTADYLPTGVQNLGPVDANTSEQVLLGLEQTAAQKAAEQEFLNELTDRSSPNFHQFLTPQEFAARFGVSSQEVAAVTQWLSSMGFTNVTSSGPTALQFAGTAGQLESAFEVSINNYVVNGKTCQASPDNQSVPTDLASYIAGFSISNCFPPTPEAAGTATGAELAEGTATTTTGTTAPATTTSTNMPTNTSDLPWIVGGGIVLVIIAVGVAFFVK
jgi:subtilase family serine protease